MSDITSVLVAYSKLPTRSIAYLISLQAFETRVKDLLRSGEDSIHVDQVEKVEKDWWSSEIVAAWYGPIPGAGGRREMSERAKNRLKEREKMREIGQENQSTIRKNASYVGVYDEE